MSSIHDFIRFSRGAQETFASCAEQANKNSENVTGKAVSTDRIVSVEVGANMKANALEIDADGYSDPDLDLTELGEDIVESYNQALKNARVQQLEIVKETFKKRVRNHEG